jgi:hypothetical protein
MTDRRDGDGHNDEVSDIELIAPALIGLEIPAAAQFVATARLVAASGGADAGLTVDDLEELRLGVDELVAVLVERAGTGARIKISVAVEPGRVVVGGSISGDVAADIEPLDELSGRIVAAVTDSYELGSATFRLEKTSSTNRG